jgi:SNF2 family DNA or RNA helicase
MKTKFPDIPILQLTGAQDGQERFDIQEKFANSKRAFLVASTLASGEGINLQTCGDAILHERQWNPQNEDQAAPGRFRRIGATHKTVNVTFMTAAGTVDEILAGIVERKRAYFHNAMNKGEMPVWNERSITSELAEGIVKNFNSITKKAKL